MANFSVRLPEEMKEKMEQYPEVNWSEEVGSFLSDRLHRSRDRDLARALILSEDLTRASANHKKKDQGETTTDLVRELRDRR